MSQYILYKSRKKSLQQIGLIDRIISGLVTFALPVLILAGTLSNWADKSGVLWLVIASFWVISVIILIFYSRYVNKSLEKHGELVVNLNGIKKTIAGIESVFDYTHIKEISIKDHIRSIFFPENKDGSKTYVVSITKTNSEEEVFVISSQSVDNPRANFLESLQYIEKYKNIKLNISKK
jgi:ABC-type multidrug transport system fused ATPase/permease subunit